MVGITIRAGDERRYLLLNIVPCETKKQWRLFENIPETLHEGNRYFLPPFPGSVSRLARRSHPFHNHGELFPFIAYRDGRPVGRIAAIINETHNKYHNDQTGFFGFFDFIDDGDVAAGLLQVTEDILTKRGRTLMRGPVNPTQNDECGLLVEGFDSQPFVLMPYNPEYYPARYDELGLTKARDLYAYYIDDELPTMARTERIVERLKKKTNITVRGISLKNLEKELEIIEYLFNTTLVREWSFMPTTKADLEFAARDLKAILDPSMVLIAEVHGKPVGFSLTIPNVNEFMNDARRSKGLLRLLRLAWYVKTRRPRTARLAVLGVLPEFRSKGVAPVFYFESLKRGVRNYIAGELSWVQDINAEANKTAAIMGVRRYKSYRIYEKTLES